ncbi:MAG: carbohydrate kinase family protein [Patescibacteria group bacterium]|nr:carbohydrate kinase family protein [Patescibacteria group bacterium]MDD4304387.1 carbohydrate kinase family protein [Patescibacteria group bacterium]MDD4695410.1 carbohydrate kinase family protein [Patescibacteria group bacterium]
MKKNKRILLTGSIAYDRIMNFSGYFKDNILPNQIHNLNVSFFVHELKESFGGTAGNIGYNLALLGEKSYILANVGANDFNKYEKWFKKNNINLSLINKIKNQQTASAYIITDKADNQITGFYPGAMLKKITTNTIAKKNIDLAVISAQNPIDMTKLSKIFRSKKIKFIFDPGQQVSSLSGDDLKYCINGSYILIGNDYEINLISKKTGLSISELLKNTKIIIATLGEEGSIIYTRDTEYKINSAKPKNTSDPTGAGDAYRAGLIKGIIENWSIEKTCKFASVISVYTVEKYGTQTHKFSINSVKKRYFENFNEKLI